MTPEEERILASMAAAARIIGGLTLVAVLVVSVAVLFGWVPGY